MKINIDIDLTPKEARQMMGLPDLEPMQNEMIKKIQEKMDQSITEMSDPELLFKRYLPMGIQGIEQFQQFMSMAANAASGKTNKED